MGKFDKYIGSHPGYFRLNGENEFPWDWTSSLIWFVLFVVEDGKICRYGFTPSKSSKQNLVKILKSLDPNDENVLLGIWTGEYRTDLFLLDTEKAVINLEKVIK